VKGVAFVGVLEVLAEHGYRPERVAGTSAGAITSAVLIALTRAGESIATLRTIVDTLDLTRFPDSNRIGRLLGPFAGLAEIASLIFRGGMHNGDYAEDWLTGVLADLGVRTFGDLRRDDPGSPLPVEHNHALVVTTSDLSRRRMSLLPWDFASYGLDPDEQSVARAVRASAAIPFYFRPVEYATPHGRVSLVDGGFLSNYPITVFDHPDRAEARWPTIGVRLSARGTETLAGQFWQPVHNTVQVGLAIVDTAMHGIDARHIDDPETIARTIFVDVGAIRSTDFQITDEQRVDLVHRGRQAAEKWLSRRP
jgi:NTE family protein